MHKSFIPSVSLPVCGLVFLMSCTTAPSGPRPGTPEFFWISAQSAYRAGDHVKATDTLFKVLSTENTYTTKARVAQIMLAAGLAAGYAELADTYENGARVTRGNPTPFRKQVSIARATAAQYSLLFTDTLHRLMDSSKDASLPLPLPYPPAIVKDLPQLERLAGGVMLPVSEAEMLQTAMLHRGVTGVANRLAGAGDDVAAAMDTFKLGSVTRDRFMIGAADVLVDQAGLFGPARLDQPKRLHVLCTEALEALASVPVSPETKARESRIKALMMRRVTPS